MADYPLWIISNFILTRTTLTGCSIFKSKHATVRWLGCIKCDEGHISNSCKENKGVYRLSSVSPVDIRRSKDYDFVRQFISKPFTKEKAFKLSH